MSNIADTIRMFEDEINTLTEKIDSGKRGYNTADVASLADNKARRFRLKSSLRQIVNLEMARKAAGSTT